MLFETPLRPGNEKRAFVVHLSVTLLVLIVFTVFSGQFFGFIQSVSGRSLNDSLLSLIPAHDMSIAIFGLIYGGLFVSGIYLLRSPYILLKTLEAYVILTLFRICTLLLFPLEPDEAIIPLIDPLVDTLFYSGVVVTKDLFFSGHTALLALLAIAVKNVYLKYALWLAAFVVALLLLIQHAHYTIDVIAAPVFAWISVKIAARLMPK